MTAREMKLLALVGTVVVGALLYNLLTPLLAPDEEQGKASVTQDEAFRVLRSEENIRGRHQAALERYKEVSQYFYQLKNQAQAEVDILEVVEDIAASSGLKITLKNTVQVSPTELGVALEGETNAAVLVKFMQQLTTAPVRFKIKRLQLHGVEEKRELGYQLVASVMMVK